MAVYGTLVINGDMEVYFLCKQITRVESTLRSFSFIRGRLKRAPTFIIRSIFMIVKIIDVKTFIKDLVDIAADK